MNDQLLTNKNKKQNNKTIQSKVTSSPGSDKIVNKCLKYDGPVFIKKWKRYSTKFSGLRPLLTYREQLYWQILKKERRSKNNLKTKQEYLYQIVLTKILKKLSLQERIMKFNQQRHRQKENLVQVPQTTYSLLYQSFTKIL